MYGKRLPTLESVNDRLAKLGKQFNCLELCDLLEKSRQATGSPINILANELFPVINADGTFCGLRKFPNGLSITNFVDTYADLPDPTLNTGIVYYVLNPTGTPWWPPGYKPDGFYVSNGTTWKYSARLPINATVPQGIAGTDDVNFITSYVLAQVLAQYVIGMSNSVGDTYTAGEVISGGKALIMDTDTKVYNMDITNGYHYDKYIGIAAQAAIANDPVKVVTQGKTDVLGSGWIAGNPYYISSTGYLSNTPPVVGFTKQVGVGVNVDIINLVNYTEVIAI